MIQVVCATQRDEEAFGSCPLGISLHRMGFDSRLQRRITFSNTQGLPIVYNAAIDSDDPQDILLFIHDDVWVDDYFLCSRIEEGIKRFDVLGVAGNIRLAKGHVGWAFRGDDLRWDDKINLRGAVAHGATPFGTISPYGLTPDSCMLLDGVFLAARKSILRNSGVRFDPRFDFHFYDVDFCRTACSAGLSLGVWPIAITHNSGGSFGSPEWRHALGLYRQKWP
jgi:GT2 family glycosyltransferase